MDLDGERALVGAPRELGAIADAGAAYVLRRNGTSWSQEVRLLPGTAGSQGSGTSVALRGATAVVGAPWTSLLRGGATVFTRSGTSWTEQQWISSAASAAFDGFSSSLALLGGTVLIGDPSGPDGDGTGGVWVFGEDQGVWTEQATLLPSDNQPYGADGGSEGFGSAVAAQGETVVVGTPGDVNGQLSTGAVYVYSIGALSSFCDASDGSLASCPCSNPGNPDTGCDVAQATGGVELTVLDQEVGALPRATLVASGFPPAASPASILLRSAQLDPSAPVVFGDGLRCIGTPLVRMDTTVAVGGSSTHVIGHSALAGSGQFHYQVWFRNTPAAFCVPGASFNLSSGRTLTW